MKAESPAPNTGTLKHVHFLVPLLKAVKADNTLLDLLLNHLISTKAKHGRTIGVPLGSQVQELPTAQLCAKLTVLVETRISGKELQGGSTPASA